MRDMTRLKLDRCPWCPDPKTCEGCSLSGEPPGNYVLISEADHKRRVRKLTVRWLFVVALLVGASIAFAVGFVVVLLS